MTNQSAEHLGARVRSRRHALGMSQNDLAHKAGVSLATVYRVENGRVAPISPTVDVLAWALGCKAQDLRKP